MGTTSVRVLLFDARGRQVRGVVAQRATSLTTTIDGGAEMAPDDLMERTSAVLDEALAQAEAAGLSIAGVAMSTFWHSALGVDDRWRPTTPLYLWADSRSREAMPTLRERLDPVETHARTGCVLHWSYLPAKLLWLSRVSPAAFQATARWVSFGEYLYGHLFGQAGCSISMASGTGLLDQNKRTWDQGVIDALPISEEHLGPLIDLNEPSSGLREPFCWRWPGLASVPWYPAVGDGACSNVGSGCVTRDRVALMVGTSGAMRVAWAADSVTIPEGSWCYRIDGRRFVIGGALTNGGNLFAWLRDSLRLGTVAECERALAAMEPDGHGLTVLPFLAGERAPGYAPNARAAILGMTLATRPIDILRAGLEAVALRFALLHEIISREVPDARQVVATGGALTRSPAWVQMMADALGTPIAVSSEAEGSSRGAALLALEQLGVVPDVATLPTRTGRVYQPDPRRHAVYRTAQQRHRDYYRRLVLESGQPPT